MINNSVSNPSSKPSLHDQLYIALDVLNELPSPVLNAVAEQVIAGLSLLIRDHREVIESAFLTLFIP